MVKAIRIHETGGPEVLRLDDIAVGDPGPRDVRLRHTAIGVNFIDTYHRSGLYPLPMPSGLGVEGAGIVEAVGSDVRDFQVGDRVAYPMAPTGAYAEMRLAPADRLVKLPDDIDDRRAAAMMLKGMTAHYLLHRTYPVKAGETILFHAAAGGVGLIACQWAKALGATVIGTVGSDEKADLARAHGCDHVIVYSRENFTKRVREITGGKGVPVVYDSVGRATFDGSLDCLAPFGMMVSFGNATGPLPPIDAGVLSAKGSLYLTRPSLGTHVADRKLLVEGAEALFDVVRSGQVKIEIHQEWPLARAADAHRALEARQTTACSVLIP